MQFHLLVFTFSLDVNFPAIAQQSPLTGCCSQQDALEKPFLKRENLAQACPVGNHPKMALVARPAQAGGLGEA